MAVIGLVLGWMAWAEPLAVGADPAGQGAITWYKGCTHAHSLWSDGDEFPEMAADWYKQHGYSFLALSDHKLLLHGEKWVDVVTKKRPISDEVIEACRKRFGADWVVIRGEGAGRQIRLKTLDEFRVKLEEPGKFLLIENEEISGKFNTTEIHVSAINLAQAIQPQQGSSVLETLRLDLQAVEQQATRLDRPIVTQVNHPNWRHYDITPEVLAQAVEARFFEVCNNGPGSNYHGDQEHPGLQRFWDIANTIRIGRLNEHPLYGIASDDTHQYHELGPKRANPGRGWLMVRAQKLTTEAILAALRRGDFYATTGVVLRELAYDPQAGTLTIEVAGETGAQYTIQFVGTLADQGAEVGKVLATVQGTRASYTLSGKELFVRAVVFSDVPLPNPPEGGVDKKQAWAQPVGWERWVRH